MKPPLDERIGGWIFFLRGQQVMLDADLAKLYGVPAGALNRAVRRNAIRFPKDFMFRLTIKEARASRCQFGTLNRGQNIKYLPYAFTEQGVAMLSSVLRSRRAVQVNITIMRAFVRMRRILGEHKNLAQQLKTLEKKFDVRFRIVFTEIRKLMDKPEPPRRRIGFGA